MKRENLESKEFGLIIASRNFPFYAAPEADAVMDGLEQRIKELEAENERLMKDLEHARSYKHTIKMRNRNLHTENERLKREPKQTEAQDKVVIDGLRKENRKTLHALWMARVLRAHTEKLFYFNLGMNTISEKWAWAERKCLVKAKEYE